MAAVQAPGEPSSCQPVRLVLCMIVRNEARTIERCLRSALAQVDAHVICDTGSNDATVERVQHLAAEYGVPGLVCHHAWRNFGHNRSLAANTAREWVNAAGWDPCRTYLLLMDADMVLHADGFDKQTLAASAYALAQDERGLCYYNTRLICLRHEWRAQGATHEYWETTDGSPSVVRLGSMWIEDMGDGGSKQNKYMRDIALLRQTLAQSPADPRAMFYLAQSYFDVGHFNEASRWYARRIKLGGWEEEVWYAAYRRGLCAVKTGDLQRATALLLEAFDLRPTRAEPLKVLAQLHREQGRHHSAFMFAARGITIAFPEADVLFVERGVYQWQLWEEIMITAYYVGMQFREMGMSACERLCALRSQEPWFYDYVARNQAYYLDEVVALRRGVMPLPADLVASATATVTHESKEFENALVGLGNFEDNPVVVWERPDGLFLIGYYDPFVVFCLDAESGRWREAHRSTPRRRAEKFRGECAPISIASRSGCWLMLVRERSSPASGSVDSHRWIELSCTEGLTRHSRPFKFQNHGAIRVMQMWSQDAERLCVVYECDGTEAHWVELSWDTVLATLREAEGDYS